MEKDFRENEVIYGLINYVQKIKVVVSNLK